MKETLSNIAKRTGFSVTTISRVLSGNAEKYRISKKTAELITADAKNHNYMPSGIAQSLRTNKTNTIGLLLPSLANPYFAEMASFIVSEVHRKGFTTIVIDTMEDEHEFNTSVMKLYSRGVDGIIAVPCGTDKSLIEEIDKKDIPVVLVDRYFDDSRLSYVATNNYKGGLMATQFLISMGHKRITCIQGAINSTPNKERVKGYTDAMREAGLEDNIMIAGNEFSIQNGYLETKMLLSENDLPTAVFSLGNTISLGIIKAIKETTLKIPENLSLISFDNYFYMDYMETPITRISQPIEDMAKLATKILFDRIESIPTSTSQLKLSPSLIYGESVVKY